MNKKAKEISTRRLDIKNSYDLRPIQVGPDVNLFIQGPRNDYSITIGSDEGTGKVANLRDLAPKGTKFINSSTVFDSPVRIANIKGKVIEIAASGEFDGSMAYGLLHAIGRLNYHANQKSHDESMKVHRVVDPNKLKDSSRIGVSKDFDRREKQFEAWEKVVEEERQSSIYALNMVRRLFQEGINPLANIGYLKDLVKLVNSLNILRTAKQIVLKNLHLQVGDRRISMALTENEVANVIEGFSVDSSRPFDL